MTADEAKQNVLAVHHGATAWCGWGVDGLIAIWAGLRAHSTQLSFHHKTEDAAWIDAASKLPTPIPTPVSDDLDVVPNAPSIMRRCPDGRVCVGGCVEGLCARVEVIDRLPSTEESGEPKRVTVALRRIHNRIEVIAKDGKFDERDTQFIQNELMDVWDHHSMTPTPASTDYLRGKLDELKIENDRLQTSNAAMRRRLEDIANQYAVDCL